MILSVAVVAHPARLGAAEKLAADLSAGLFVDEYGMGEWENHARALAWAAEGPSSHVLVVQDDAVPIPGFLRLAAEAVEQYPDGPIGFYVGRQRPIRRTVERAVRTAEQQGASWLEHRSLLWGVATSVPVADIPLFLEWARSSRLPYDERLGEWYRRRGVPVRYTWPSLVDHADGPSVITGRAARAPGRVAWRVGEPKWGGPVVPIR